ncbi:carbon-nitrogen hydrolase family protein [Campylobacter sp. MIT 21-1685]|uniref:carbon-nitrogen hydrolase family protein n=1 Tax=unclassified Campylobacter TaxID=2593542 RepID=UPI00224B1AED|nr:MULTISPECIES: carbon-nitrogen hydrolase family protein [unclassified Campylobacter]MCX2682551.1 carbon-nitrogen hydrolase family protein [Campylobacter sp. MIT 21-1684]MCX2750736.1 carbon-nitrogen hydrolase family protein [Campylobacter sp. MIT 21-1682]MCX2807032.1 carbon-nitrogen hydrolase family protein [Campylobacter sp. MIT 21-1685]
MRKLKVAIIQFAPSSYEIQNNLDKALFLIQKALEQGAKLIVLPELFDSGYCVEDKDKHYALSLKNCKHQTLKNLLELAKKYQSYIVGCSIEKERKKLFDTAYILGKDGLVGIYRKIYLWANEKQRFAHGKLYPVFELEFEHYKLKLGLQICYEIGFAEGARLLALQGAELICYPAAFGKAREYVWDLASRARALENGVFVLAANRSGKENSKLNTQELFFGGKSKIINPRGEILQELLEEEGILCEEIDLEICKIQRQSLPYLQDLNIKLHHKTLQNIYTIQSQKKE